MAEKILNSRIQLRYDSYANWTNATLGDGKGANFVLNAGEIGICYIPTDSSVEQVNGTQPPQILMKVGNGSSKFSELPWTSAKAADVYDWAKQASLPVTKEGEGNVVSGIAWDPTTKGIKFTTASVATSEGLASLQGRVKTIEDTYATDAELEAAVNTINAAVALKADKTYVDTELGKKVNSTDFETFKGENTTAIGNAKDAAIAAAKTETETQIANLSKDGGAIKANADAIAAIKDGATMDSFLDVENAIANITLTTGTANGTVKFNGEDVAVKGLGSAAYTESSAYATAAQGALADSAVQAVAIASGSENGKIKLTVDGAESEAAVTGLKSAAFTEASAYATAEQGTKADSAVQKVTVLGKELANGGSVSAEEAKTALGLKSAAYVETSAFDAAGAAAAVQGNTTSTVKDAIDAAAAAQADIDAFMAAADTGEAALDTLREIQDFLNSDDGTVQILVDKVAANEEAIADVVDGTTVVAKATHAVNADVAAKASGLDDAGVAAVKAVKVDAATDADKLGGIAAADYALESELTDGTIVVAKATTASGLDATGVAQVEGIKVDNAGHADTAGNATQLGGAAAADYLKKTDAPGYADILTKTDAVGLYQAKGDYASAAQGEKADTAVQTGSFAGTAMTKVGTELSISQADARTALGLGSAAYKAEADFATAAQGAKADSALQAADIVTGTANGTIAVKGADVAVAGLKSAAYTEASAYATAEQGGKADTALQSVAVGDGLKVSEKANNTQTIEIDTEGTVFILNGGTSETVL